MLYRCYPKISRAFQNSRRIVSSSSRYTADCGLHRGWCWWFLDVGAKHNSITFSPGLTRIAATWPRVRSTRDLSSLLQSCPCPRCKISDAFAIFCIKSAQHKWAKSHMTFLAQLFWSIVCGLKMYQCKVLLQKNAEVHRPFPCTLVLIKAPCVVCYWSHQLNFDIDTLRCVHNPLKI